MQTLWSFCINLQSFRVDAGCRQLNKYCEFNNAKSDFKQKAVFIVYVE